jgi:flagellar hook-basal body complex protein FliE
MPVIPIDPSFVVSGGEWNIAPIPGAAPVTPADGAAGGGGFGGMLANQIGALEKVQNEAAQGAQSLAAGTATDPTAVVMSVERARLSMQLASQVRTKVVDALQDVFHTQV